MALGFRKLHPLFAAETGAIDLRKADDRATLDEIRAGMDEYAVLVFRDQPFADEEQLAFARRFDGELHAKTGASVVGKNRFGNEALTDISNVDEGGALLKQGDRRRAYSLGNRLWHTDASFQDPPGRYSMLSAKVVPAVAADTEFADLRAAYDALPDATKRRIADLVAEHSLMTSRAKLGFADFDEEERKAFEPVPQVLVRRLQDSGRMSLYIASHAGSIRGMAKAEAEKLLKELIDHATQRQFVYTHRWRLNDLVMWDDRCTMHRGLEFDDQRYKRDMRRATVSDVAPTCEQMGLAVAAE
jgi:alpha-ketoglutarate-dependent 2,4-dichlorophenoxyacetate dioxygenase